MKRINLFVLRLLKRVVAIAYEKLERKPIPASGTRRIVTHTTNRNSKTNSQQETFTLITGGNGSIGREAVKKFHEVGHTVVIIDRNRPKYDEFTGKVIFHRANLLDNGEIVGLGKFISESSIKLSYVVNLAGGPVLGDSRGLDGIQNDEIDESVALNLIAPIKLTKSLMSNMEDGGSFTYVGSLNAMSCYDLPAYSAAKGGLSGFVRSILNELGSRNIRANIVIPGSIYSDYEYDGRDFNKIKNSTPLGAIATNHEIAALIVEVALSTVLNGAEIIADKGQSKIPPSFKKVV